MNHDDENDMKWLKGDAINVMNIYSGVLMHMNLFQSAEHAIHELCSVSNTLVELRN